MKNIWDRISGMLITFCMIVVLQITVVIFDRNHQVSAAQVLIKPSIILTHNGFLYGYTESGIELSKVAIDATDVYTSGRDLVSLKDGNVALVSDSFDTIPKLNIYNAANNQWSRLGFSDWRLPNSKSEGAIATQGEFVYVTTFAGGSGGKNGIIRFNLNDGSANSFLEHKYIDINIGLDGYMYALRNAYGQVDKIELDTMTLVENLQLPMGVSDSRAITADAVGNVYVACWDGVLRKFDTNSVLIGSLAFGDNHFDVDFDGNGNLLITDWRSQVYFVNSLLSSVSSFNIDGSRGNEGAYVGAVNASTVLRASDIDGDGVADFSDNCPTHKNPLQEDVNDDNIGDLCESDVLDFISPIIAAANSAPIAPEWGVFNQLCCPASSAIFSATVDADTLYSSRASCSAEPTFQGFKASTDGLKTFSSSLSSASCGYIPIDFNFAFENAKRYLFQMELDQGAPAVFVYSENISADDSIKGGARMNRSKSMKMEKLILLSSEKSILGKAHSSNDSAIIIQYRK